MWVKLVGCETLRSDGGFGELKHTHGKRSTATFQQRPWRNESPNTVRTSLRSGIQILMLAANSLKIAVAWNQANHCSCHWERTTAWRKCMYICKSLISPSDQQWGIVGNYSLWQWTSALKFFWVQLLLVVVENLSNMYIFLSYEVTRGPDWIFDVSRSCQASGLYFEHCFTIS